MRSILSKLLGQRDELVAKAAVKEKQLDFLQTEYEGLQAEHTAYEDTAAAMGKRDLLQQRLQVQLYNGASVDDEVAVKTRILHRTMHHHRASQASVAQLQGCLHELEPEVVRISALLDTATQGQRVARLEQEKLREGYWAQQQYWVGEIAKCQEYLHSCVVESETQVRCLPLHTASPWRLPHRPAYLLRRWW